MNFSLNEVWSVTLPTAQVLLPRWLDRWSSFVRAEGEAIKELKALDSDVRTSEVRTMESRVTDDLPAVSSSDLVENGLLVDSNDPFKRYIEQRSIEWTRAAVDVTVPANKDKYSTWFRDILNDKKKTGHLGTYFFDLSSLELNAENISPQTFTMRLQTVVTAKLETIADRSIQDIDQDSVGLKDAINDIKSAYIARLKGPLVADVDSAYKSRAEDFERTALERVFRDLVGVLGKP
ncbi:MAG: hypothetical protein HY817_03995 [Candidatus Abawacabacteria bacterium]|nr:hypothetical protein [Candidatus Abawacabacteria bacterium]